MATFGSRLKQFRERRSLSVAEVAKRINVPPSTYREWEYGRAIKGEPYIDLANALGVSLYELMSGEKTKTFATLQKFEQLEKHLLDFKKDLLSLL